MSGEPLGSRNERRLARDYYAGSLHFGACLRRITSVRKQDGLVFSNEQNAGASGKTAEVSDVGQVGNQQ